MSITLTQLRALEAVARTGSFGAAARELGITQPAVSQQLAALQRALGVVLFERLRNRPQLSEAGRFVLERALPVVRDADHFERDVREYAGAQAGTLHIGATQTIGTYRIAPFLARFLAARPHVRPRIEIGNTRSIAARIESGEITLGLVEGPIDGLPLEAVPFGGDRLVLVLHPAHRLAGLRVVRARDLAGEPFVSRESGSGTRDYGYEALLAAGISAPVVLELPTAEAILHAVEAGIGVALLSELAVRRAVDDGAVRALRIRDLPLERSFRALYRRDLSLPPLASAFLDALRSS